MTQSTPPKDRDRHARRVPANSIFYDRLFPIILITLTLITLILILIAAGVLLGIIHYR